MKCNLMFRSIKPNEQVFHLLKTERPINKQNKHTATECSHGKSISRDEAFFILIIVGVWRKKKSKQLFQ